MPKTQSFFWIELQPTEAALAAQRLEKILKAFPEPDPSLAIPLNSVTHADFDSQLNRL